MSVTEVLDTRLLKDQRQAAEARGLTFYLNPPRELVPSFLATFSRTPSP